MVRHDPYASITPEVNQQMERYKTTMDDKCVQRAVRILRSINRYPTPNFDLDGEIAEIIKCIQRDVDGCLMFTSNASTNARLKCRYLQGLTLCRHIFPEIAHVRRKAGAKSVHDAFMDDHELFKALKYLFRTRPKFNAPQLHSVLGISAPCTFNNYNPSRMKALCERFCPKGGVVYDYSAGFGGRMLGCLTSKNDYTYVAVDPNPHIQKHYATLQKLISLAWKRLGVSRVGKAHVKCIGSEHFCPSRWINTVDFAMSCPPYWEREHYTDDKAQCYNQFKTLEKWLDGYVKPTIANIHRLCKVGAFAGFQIMDYGKVRFVDEWLNIVRAHGFVLHCTINCQIESRTGSGHDRHELKTERIYIFQKV